MNQKIFWATKPMILSNQTIENSPMYHYNKDGKLVSIGILSFFINPIKDFSMKIYEYKANNSIYNSF